VTLSVSITWHSLSLEMGSHLMSVSAKCREVSRAAVVPSTLNSRHFNCSRDVVHRFTSFQLRTRRDAKIRSRRLMMEHTAAPPIP
jgi:hypothetical protein